MCASGYDDEATLDPKSASEHSPRSSRHPIGCARPGAKTKNPKPPNLFETGGCSASACVPGPDESSQLDARFKLSRVGCSLVEGAPATEA